MSGLLLPAEWSTGNPEPVDIGWKVWTFDPAIIPSGVVIPVAGLLYVSKMWTRRPESISSAGLLVTTAGAGLTNVGVALYSAAGTLLTSSVNANGATAAAFQAVGLKTVTFTTPQTINGGFYVGFWFTGTTLPALARGTTVQPASQMGLAAPNLRFASANASLTTTAPGTMSAQTSTSNAFFACAA